MGERRRRRWLIVNKIKDILSILRGCTFIIINLYVGFGNVKIIEKTKERKFAVAVIGFWGRRGVSFIF